MASLLSHVALNRVLSRIKDNHGFLDNTDLEALKVHCPLRQVLVRCNMGRFLCAAQDARHFCDIIDASEKDWVRDVSLPTTDQIWK